MFETENTAIVASEAIPHIVINYTDYFKNAAVKSQFLY